MKKTWRCFHCDEVFRSVAAAREHFGTDQLMSDPACLIKQSGELALLRALRNAEEELQRYRNDDSDILRAMHSMESDHAQALRREEEKGYSRGVSDARREVVEELKGHPLGFMVDDSIAALEHTFAGTAAA